jgi:hypothetical protein
VAGEEPLGTENRVRCVRAGLCPVKVLVVGRMILDIDKAGDRGCRLGVKAAGLPIETSFICERGVDGAVNSAELLRIEGGSGILGLGLLYRYGEPLSIPGEKGCWRFATVYPFEISCGLGAASGVRGPVFDGV